MTGQFNYLPLVSTSVEKLMHLYIKNGMLDEPGTFFLNTFREDELAGKLFSRSGDVNYSLLERRFRVIDSMVCVNLKVYYSAGVFVSNGIDVFGARVSTVFRSYSRNFSNQNLIKLLEIYVDDSFEFGSILINECIDVRFGKVNDFSARAAFKIIGISTDAASNEEWARKMVATTHAKATKNHLRPRMLSNKCHSYKSLFRLISCLRKIFPNVCIRTC